MAGPWFTVIECNNQWTTADSILISDGESHVQGKIEIKAVLVAQSDTGKDELPKFSNDSDTASIERLQSKNKN